MTTTQKIIKYLALAFAIFLIVSILGGIASGIAGIAGLSWLFDGEELAGEEKTYTVTDIVEQLYLDVSAGEIHIQAGASFQVVSNHKYLKVTTQDGALRISESKKLHNPYHKDVVVTLTIPDGYEFSCAELVTGAGVLAIDRLTADKLSLSLGAGEATIDTLIATQQARIQGGAGAVTVSDGSLKNLDMEMGVGELNLTSRLEGSCQLEYGVGEANLTLLGSLADYRITFDKGLGDGKLEGKRMDDDSTYGTGSTHVEIDGGIGALRIEFA